MVREDAPRRCPRAGSSSRADSAIEERLPLPFRSEVSQPGEIERTAARHAGACRSAENPAHAGDRGCGCGVADVAVRLRCQLGGLMSYSEAVLRILDQSLLETREVRVLDERRADVF